MADVADLELKIVLRDGDMTGEVVIDGSVLRSLVPTADAWAPLLKARLTELMREMTYAQKSKEKFPGNLAGCGYPGITISKF